MLMKKLVKNLVLSQ